MLTLIDGYNVTKGDPATRGLPLEAQRHALVARLRARADRLLGAGHAIVVFDGAGGAGDTRCEGSPVEVRFSREGIADDLIVRLAAEAGEKVVLVSSDAGLALRVRTHAPRGCEVRPRETLFEGAPGKARRGRRHVPGASAGIPRGGNEITRELKRLWLTDGE